MQLEIRVKQLVNQTDFCSKTSQEKKENIFGFYIYIYIYIFTYIYSCGQKFT